MRKLKTKKQKLNCNEFVGVIDIDDKNRTLPNLANALIFILFFGGTMPLFLFIYYFKRYIHTSHHIR
jgi:hypothetical protein